MRSLLKIMFALALVVAVASTSFAQQEGKKKKKGGPGQPQAIAALMKKAEGLGLTAEQTQKIKAIAETHAPKFREANEKMAKVLTEEQKKARQEVMAKNKADGKKGKEAQAAIDAAVALTDDQKKVQKEVQAETRELTKKLNDEVSAVLTPEQKEKFAPAAKPKKVAK